MCDETAFDAHDDVAPERSGGDELPEGSQDELPDGDEPPEALAADLGLILTPLIMVRVLRVLRRATQDPDLAERAEDLQVTFIRGVDGLAHELGVPGVFSGA